MKRIEFKVAIVQGAEKLPERGPWYFRERPAADSKVRELAAAGVVAIVKPVRV